MADERISLYRQTLADRQHEYDAAISSGDYTPFLYPWDTLPAIYLFLAIALTPRLSPRWARDVRYTAFALIIFHGAYVVSHRCSLWFAGGIGIGLSTAWGTVMSLSILICNDISSDFKRLETRPVGPTADNHLQNGSAVRSTSSGVARDVDLRSRKVPSVYTASDTKEISPLGPAQPATELYRFVWQGFPLDGSLLHLIDWTVDLMTSFRGVGWKHRISTTGSLDAPCLPRKPLNLVECKIGQEAMPTSISVQNLRALRRRAVQDFVISCLLLDLLKTIMITDPYFLGRESLASPTPWHWLACINQIVPIATRVVRLSVSMVGVIVALTFIFSLSPLFFTVILPSLIDVSKITKAPLLEPGLYPPMWHPLATSVMHSGLAGFWGKFWHQMFRFGISEPSRVLIERFHLDPRGNMARVVQLSTAFGLSGSIHALGSYTAFSLQQSHPISGPLVFFLLQASGVFLQSSASKLLNKHLLTKPAPPMIRKGLNLIFVLIWLYFTGPLLADDFAICGIWLFEPFPISLLRGLGFGPGGKDEVWWIWYQEGSRSIGWWKGDRWWHRAVAIF